MGNLRDIFYINILPENNELVYCGLKFEEFYRFIPIKLRNILLVKSEYFGSRYSSSCNMPMVDEKEMKELLQEDIYSYGSFCWVDYDDIESVNHIQAQEVAELLYLGHMFLPLNSPFFESIKNRYAYLAHDDGWFCRLYCRQYSDFSEVIANKVISEVSVSGRKIYPMNEELKQKLLSLACEGLLIDLGNIQEGDKSIEVPIYQIGKFLNMDSVYNDLEKHKVRARYAAKLVYVDNNWRIDLV